MDLADDLESFVYVVLYMALRFHRHNLSPQCTATVSERDLVRLNKSNNALAFTVYELFCEEREVGRYRIGGGHKLQNNLLSGHPPLLPFDLVDSKSHLARLIDRLYAVLRRQYRSVDFDELQKYKPAEPPRPRPIESDAQRQRRNEIIRRPVAIGKRSLAALLARHSSDSEDDETPSKPPPRLSPILHRHLPMLEAFESPFHDDDHLWRGVPKVKPDKFVDQFLGLHGRLDVCPQPDSTSPSEEDDDDEDVTPAKRPRISRG